MIWSQKLSPPEGGGHYLAGVFYLFGGPLFGGGYQDHYDLSAGLGPKFPSSQVGQMEGGGVTLCCVIRVSLV